MEWMDVPPNDAKQFINILGLGGHQGELQFPLSGEVEVTIFKGQVIVKLLSPMRVIIKSSDSVQIVEILKAMESNGFRLASEKHQGQGGEG